MVDQPLLFIFSLKYVKYHPTILHERSHLISIAQLYNVFFFLITTTKLYFQISLQVFCVRESGSVSQGIICLKAPLDYGGLGCPQQVYFIFSRVAAAVQLQLCSCCGFHFLLIIGQILVKELQPPEILVKHTSKSQQNSNSLQSRLLIVRGLIVSEAFIIQVLGSQWSPRCP